MNGGGGWTPCVYFYYVLELHSDWQMHAMQKVCEAAGVPAGSKQDSWSTEYRRRWVQPSQRPPSEDRTIQA